MTGMGAIKGLVVTLREFFSTYTLSRVGMKLFGKRGEGIFTVSYPKQRQEHAERLRVFPFLVFDSEPDDMRCVGCKICAQECPPQCIHIEQAKDEKGAPAKRFGRTYPEIFEIDISICMSCRICADVCPFDAIEMDDDFEVVNYSRGGRMLYTRDQLLKAASHFERIKPEEYAVVESRLRPKRAKAAALAAKPKGTDETKASDASPETKDDSKKGGDLT